MRLLVCMLAGLVTAQAFVHHASAFAGTSLACRSIQQSLPSLSMSGEKGDMKEGTMAALFRDACKNIATVSLAGVIAVSSITAVPSDAHAAGSSGRMGGRSFSSPSRSFSAPSRSYSAPSRSFGGGGPSLMPVPVPMYGGGFGGFSPFGYSPFMSPGISIYGGGFGVNPVDLLVLGAVAYGATQLIKGGGVSFGDLDDQGYSSLGEGVDVLKIQVAVNSMDRSPRSILGALNKMSARSNTDTRSGLASIVSEVSLELLRKQVDWVASSSDMEHFSNRNSDKAESKFNQLSMGVRSKMQRETRVSVDGMGLNVDRMGGMGAGMIEKPTLAVVTIVLALRGESLKRLGLERNINGISALRNALETLASGAVSDQGENVLAAEVLWTPEEPWEVLTREEAINDFPELMDL